MICDKSPVLLLSIILQYSETLDHTLDNSNPCASRCTGCSYGYGSRNCDATCNTRCKGSYCHGSKCKEGCQIGWYGDECTERCSSCWYGCHQKSGICITPVWLDVHDSNRDDTEEEDYRSTKIPNRFGTALKVCAAIVCIAVIMFIVATCCRRREMPDRVTIASVPDGDYDVDSSSSSSSSRFGQAILEEQPCSPRHERLVEDSETERDENEFGDFIVVVEPTVPNLMLDDSVTEYEAPQPGRVSPHLPPPPPPPPPPPLPTGHQPVSTCAPPPSYQSLFPESDNNT